MEDPNLDQVTSEVEMSDALPTDKECWESIKRRSTLQTLVPSDSNQVRKLCIHCQYIFDHWYEVLENEYQVKFFHCASIFDLQISAASGCALCAQFLRNLASRGEADVLRAATINLLNKGYLPQRSWIRVASLSRIVSKGNAVGDSLLLELRFYLDGIEEEESDSGSGSGRENELFDEVSCRVAGKVILLPSLISQSSIEENHRRLSPNSKHALWLAKSWLEKCCQSHKLCYVSQPTVPTRLLRLDRDRVRLCLSSSLESFPRYATLSHCWGSLKLLKLTTRNLQLLQDGIPREALCQTFQDAVYISQELGLQYLWIDSLCIIQDDPGDLDWMRESQKMSSVYGSSTINIAASSASDGNGGCFYTRDPDHKWCHRVKTSVKGQEKYYECIEDGILDACLFQTPLVQRGWVLQERLLAPRTLHFSSTQLFWECNCMNACEVFPHQFPTALSYGDFYLHKQPVSRSLWWKIVQLYSVCSLTYSKDKLVAISGLAREIYNQNQEDEYLVGLWRKDMEVQLCWKNRYRTSRPFPQRAPTWSWVSVDGTISYGLPHPGRLYIEILDVNIWVHDPFGEIPGAKLTLSCEVLIRGTFDRNERFFGSRIMIGETSYRFRTNLDCLEIQGEAVYLLPVSDVEILGTQRYTRGLLLQPTWYEHGEYVRIGHFEYPGDFEDISSDQEHHAQSSDYSVITESGGGKKCIVII